ncbi:MAG TPA: hypothetical protein VE175_05690, partial [Woeseiaceae bacterium]|nr:hypothetical protein [Woeseiaceae bacterium]
MSNARGNRNVAELRRFMKQWPEADVMELLIADLAGVLRGKRVRGDEFEHVFRDGFCLPGGAVLLDTLGEVVPGIPYTAEDGDPDIFAAIVPGSLAPVPWASRPTAQALFRFHTGDGERFFADPRFVLERAAGPLRKMKLEIVMAAELEFYLLDGKSDR